MVKEISDAQILLDFRRKKPRYIVYWVGEHDDHVMDWSGGNVRRIKAQGQRKGGFYHYKDATRWAKKNKPKDGMVYGIGQHVPDNEYDNHRIVKRDVTQEEFEDLKAAWKEQERKSYNTGGF